MRVIAAEAEKAGRTRLAAGALPDIVESGVAGEIASADDVSAKALPPPWWPPNSEPMELNKSAPPIAPTAEAAAVPRNDPPPRPGGSGGGVCRPPCP